MKQQAIILAGGLGTRLKGVIGSVPKPMADIAGRPFLEYLLAYLQRERIRDVVISVGYLADQIKRHFGSRFMDIDVRYSVEHEPLGTGGALKKAMTICDGGEILALNGDTLLPVIVDEFAAAHRKSDALISIALKKIESSDRYGTVEIQGGTIVGFAEKKYVDSGWINGGMYLLNPGIVDHFPQEDRFSFEIDFLQKIVGRISIGAYCFDEYFIDIGTPTDYERAQKELPRLFP